MVRENSWLSVPNVVDDKKHSSHLLNDPANHECLKLVIIFVVLVLNSEVKSYSWTNLCEKNGAVIVTRWTVFLTLFTCDIQCIGRINNIYWLFVNSHQELSQAFEKLVNIGIGYHGQLEKPIPFRFHSNGLHWYGQVSAQRRRTSHLCQRLYTESFLFKSLSHCDVSQTHRSCTLYFVFFSLAVTTNAELSYKGQLDSVVIPILLCVLGISVRHNTPGQ